VNPIATLANPFPASLVPTNPIFNVTSAEVDRNHRDGYYQNWNVAAGYELSPDAVIEVRYVGARGTNLDSSLTNFNSPDPDPGAGAVNLQSRRPYPAFGRIRMWVTDGQSDYHSMQTEFKQRGGPEPHGGLHVVAPAGQPAGRAERLARETPESPGASRANTGLPPTMCGTGS
jgi:hypothetical protein